MADKKELTADQQAELDEIFARARACLLYTSRCV